MSSTGSTTASSTGSRTASSTGSGSGTAASWWPSAYDASGTPAQTDPGNHNVGKDCMNCHTNVRQLAFGGTVFSGGKGVAHVQVGIKSGSNFYSTYSDADGNIWLSASAATIDWTKAEIRLRNSSGEKTMTTQGAAGCNSCHTGAQVLTP